MNFQERTNKIIQNFQDELKTIRTGRPATALVENLEIEYYGQKMPVKQASTATIVPPREIRIQAWDKEGANAIASAIEKSSLGLQANTEGNVIRVFLPELSVERRKDLSKHVKKVAEGYRIQIRATREEANKEIEKAEDTGELTEDDKFKQKEQIQKETDQANKKIEELLENKVNEINS